MSTILQNSIWPNTEGNLGTIKVQIPDGVNTFWPEGDALVHNFVYKDGMLVGFVDTKALTVNDSKSTTFPYDYVNIHLESIKEGDMTVEGGAKPEYLIVTYGTGNSGNTIVLGTIYANCTDAAAIRRINSRYFDDVEGGGNVVDGVWSESLENLKTQFDENTGIGGLFYNCSHITHFYSDLSSLTDGQCMFTGCTELKTFEADLSNLKTARNMFSYYKGRSSPTSSCISLPSFNVNVPLLYDGAYMFCGCESLTSFESDLPSLLYGQYMFGAARVTYGFLQYKNYSACPLKSFSVNVPILANGNYMFNGCTSLTSFSSALPKLESGEGMFTGCKLDTASIKNIAETINTVTNSPSIHIGIGSTTPTEEENQYLTQIHEKGWQVFVNGSSDAYVPATTTLDETGETITSPIPFWAKPVPSDEEHAQYVDENGNFFNILGAQFIYVSDPETYGVFTCEEDAAINMGLTKIEREN